MKKIFFLLLFTIASYGQAVFDEGIQITGNANSATATKVNVQEANGKVNTQTINTGFNKNIGLGGSDVVGANTLLNQYSTTPLDWTATAFNSGQVVFYGGKQWIAKIATVAGDVPSVSSKWEEITFEALANKTVIVDQTIIDGSTNAVSSNAVFDELTLKANDNNVVKLTGNQLISGIKTISNNVNETRLQLTNTATSTREVLRVTNPSGSVANGSEFYNNSNSLGKGAIYVNSSGSGAGLLSEISSGSSNTNAIRVEVPSVDTIENAVVFNTATNSNLGNHLAFKVNNQNVATVSKSGAVTAKSFTKSGGTSSQFLKADGSLDSNTYALASSVHNPVTLGTANGLSLSTQQLSLGLASSGVTGALSGTDWSTFNNKENAFSKNTAFNKPFGTTAGTVVEGGTLGSNAYNSTAYLPLSGGTLTGILNIDGVDSPKIFFQQNSSLISLFTNNFGIYGTGSKTDFNTYVYGNNPYGIWTNGVKRVTVGGDGNTTFSGTISASPATTADQVVVKSQLDAVAARPYKVYTALLKQSGTNAPTATVLENTLGGTVVWSRLSTGLYNGTLSAGVFTASKTVKFATLGYTGISVNSTIEVESLNTNIMGVITRVNGTQTDDVMSNGGTSIEFRVYN